MAHAPRPRHVATSVLVEPGSHATPGSVATLRVHARNVTTSPLDLIVAVVGLESGWLPAPVPVADVAPDATVTVELPLLPPVGAAPGDYPFVVTVESAPAGGATGTSGTAARTTSAADGALRVDGTSGLLLSVEPADTRGVRSKRVQVVLANTGDQPARVELSALADGDGFVELGAPGVEVAPHSSVRVRARAGTSRPLVFGRARRTAYHVTATGARAPQRFDASFTARPVLPGSALRAVSILTVAVLWVGLVLAALPWLSDRFSGRDRSVDEQAGVTTSAPAGGATTGAGDGGAGSGGTGGAGGAGGGGAGSGGGSGEDDAADDGVRVAGVVTSSDPSGVTVQVVPAGALPAAQSIAPASTSQATTGSTQDTSADGVLDGRTSRDVPADTADDAPVGKVWGLAAPVERTDVASQRRTTTTGDDGSWAFAGLSPNGRYLLTFAKAGYETQRFWVTGAEAAAAPLELELTPGRGRLAGTVTGPDGPAGGVELTISDGTTSVTTRTATTGDVGAWEVDGLATPSTYLVSASSAGLGAQSALVGLRAAGSRVVHLGLQAGVATVAGLVSGRDAYGGQGGLGGVRVTARSGETERSATTVTGDRRGTFVLPDLPVGRWTLTFEADGYATQTRRLTVTPGGAPEQRATLTSVGGTVSGTATDEDGVGVAAAGLTLTGSAGTFKTMSSSDQQGTYRFDGIPAGDYTLVAEQFGHEPTSAQVTVVGSRSATAHLVLRTLEGDGLEATSRIRGRVTDATTGARITCPNLLPGEQCEVTVTTTRLAPDGSSAQVEAHAEPDRAYELPGADQPGLFPGLYRLAITAPGYEPATVDVTVPMGQVVEAATVALYPSPSIVGSVAARVGVVPDDTCVVAVVADGPAPSADPCRKVDDTCTTDTGWCAYIGLNGSYQLERLSSGSYDVYVVPPHDGQYVRPDDVGVSLLPGDVRRVDWLLDRLGVLTVSVYSTDGTGAISPAAGAVVTADSGSSSASGSVVDGIAQLTHLPSGTYTVSATATSGQKGEVTGVQLGLNQEVQVQVVLTGPTGDVTMRVVTLLGGSGESPVANAHVTVSGVTGYRGLSPVQTTGVPVATTNATGQFTVCTTGSCSSDPSVTVLPLVEKRMNVRVTATGYADYSVNGLDVESTAPITLTPLGRAFSGSVQLLGAATPEYDDVTFTVTQAPPGVGQISITPDAAGVLSWSDSQQPVGSGLIRPGTYTVAASLDGFLGDSKTIIVLPGDATPVPPLDLVLRRNGTLRVSIVDAGTSVGIPDGAATITRNSVQDRRTALPGQTFVDLGEFAPATYSVDVAAAGYETKTVQVTVVPGQTTATPAVVPLVRLSTIHGAVKSQVTPYIEEGVTGARVEGVGPATAGSTTTTKMTATTADQGSYSLTGTLLNEGLHAGSWALSATAQGYDTLPQSSASVTILADGTDQAAPDLLLKPRPGTLVVFVSANGTGQEDLSVRLTYQDGSPAGTPTKLPTCEGLDATCDPASDAPGTYVFTGLAPLTYTINVSGGTFSPLSMSVPLASGETKVVPMQVTAPNGSVQGIVQLQAANGTFTPRPDVEVTLHSDDPAVADRTETTGTDGRYRFPTVAAGTYVVSASDLGLSASRTVVLQPGDGLVVDLVLSERTYALTVTVTSSSDLTGALVNLTGGSTTPAAQPVVRASATTFTTTFSQLPAASWTATLSGPAGHLGVWTQPATITDQDASVAFTVSETQVRLRAETSATGTPDTVTATITPEDGDASDVLVAVGGGDTVVWVPRAGATVSATTTGGWDLEVAPSAVPDDAAVQLVRITLRARETTLAVTDSSGSVERGDDVDVSARVRTAAGSANVSVGEVVLERRTSTSPTTWTEVDRATPGSDGVASLSAGTLAWPVGTAVLRVRYEGAGAYADAGPTSVDNVTVTATSTTTTLVATATTLTATVTSGAGSSDVPQGTVAFEEHTGTGNGAGSWTTITGCGSVSVSSAGKATCTSSVDPEQDVRARFTGQGSSWQGSTGTATTPAAPAGGGDDTP